MKRYVIRLLVIAGMVLGLASCVSIGGSVGTTFGGEDGGPTIGISVGGSTR